MAKRRKLRGKKLLVATVTLAGAGASFMHGCGESTVANLVPPPPLDATFDATLDAMDDATMDAVVANLVAPPPDAGPEAGTEAGPAADAAPTD